MLQQVLDSWVSDVVKGLVSAACLLSPTGILLGGRMVREPEIFSPIKRALQEELSIHQPLIVSAGLGERAALKGVSWLTIQEIERKRR